METFLESAAPVIPVRSEKQALDWSLVLVSQGIETSIERDADGGAWWLAVGQNDYARAVRTLRQYKLENRAQPWRQELPWTGLLFDARSAVWMLLLVFVFLAGDAPGSRLRTVGMVDGQAVWGGEWWRLFTATTLHADAAHLAANATTGVLLLGLAMGSFGSGLGLLASLLAGAGGYLAGLFIHAGGYHSLGASGVVMGALGVLTSQSLSLLRSGLPAKQLIARSVLGGVLLFVILGMNPDPKTDVLAHGAGFGCGLALGGTFALLPWNLAQIGWLNRLAEAVCAALLGVAWWLALR